MKQLFQFYLLDSSLPSLNANGYQRLGFQFYLLDSMIHFCNYSSVNSTTYFQFYLLDSSTMLSNYYFSSFTFLSILFIRFHRWNKKHGGMASDSFQFYLLDSQRRKEFHRLAEKLLSILFIRFLSEIDTEAIGFIVLLSILFIRFLYAFRGLRI